ncbi:uncharacterized protein [Hemitrygon akajei]|uniref:uncharacterized protein n=1 Tax=Hemitrygon akajei TaxID=2704970 RepID=UPI003BF9C003
MNKVLHRPPDERTRSIGFGRLPQQPFLRHARSQTATLQGTAFFHWLRGVSGWNAELSEWTGVFYRERENPGRRRRAGAAPRISDATPAGVLNSYDGRGQETGRDSVRSFSDLEVVRSLHAVGRGLFSGVACQTYFLLLGDRGWPAAAAMDCQCSQRSPVQSDRQERTRRKEQDNTKAYESKKLAQNDICQKQDLYVSEVEVPFPIHS